MRDAQFLNLSIIFPLMLSALGKNISGWKLKTLCFNLIVKMLKETWFNLVKLENIDVGEVVKLTFQWFC